MFLANTLPERGLPLDPVDAEAYGRAGGEAIAGYLAFRGGAPTPLVALPALAAELGVASVSVKDEGGRLGLGSFKALGGAYAVARLVLEAASARLGRPLDFADLARSDVRAVAAEMTFTCATDGNHGRSVAQGAELVGARSAIYVHAHVSEVRSAAIARYGARMIRVSGTYDEAVAQCAREAQERGWIVVSDTSWPGYERTPGFVMQGYTAIAREALAQDPEPPTHVFLQAGIGAFPAAVAAYFALANPGRPPATVVVEPARAACFYASGLAGRLAKAPPGEATIMAMLECYEPSLVAWRLLARLAAGFQTLEEEEALAVMRRLAHPRDGDPMIVAGESGGVGLGGAIQAARDAVTRAALGLDATSRVFVVNTEGATDPEVYARLIGSDAAL